MAEAPDDSNDLNFSDIDSDEDSTEPQQKAVIAHKEMKPMIAHKEMKPVEITSPDPIQDIKQIDDISPADSPNPNFEPISPVNEEALNDTVESQTFEPISPIENKETNNSTTFENISDDENENDISNNESKTENVSQNDSDNDLNFNDDNSNDSNYQQTKDVVSSLLNKNTQGIELNINDINKNIEQSNNSESKLSKEDEISSKEESESTTLTSQEVEDIEAPVPSPFSDIGDVDDMPGTDGGMINDILKDKDNKDGNKFDVTHPSENDDQSSSQQEKAPLESQENESAGQSETNQLEVSAEVEVPTEGETQASSSSQVQATDEKKDENEDEEDGEDLIADIFGDSDEEEEDFEGFADEDLPPESAQVEESSERPSHDQQRDQDSSDDDQIPTRDFVSDFDIMLQKRKEMNRMKRRAKKDFDLVNDNDDIMAAMIRQMRDAAEEDRMLNQCGKAATKKLKMLPSVLNHLRKADLQSTFIDNGVLPAMKEWLTPLPDHALPHIKIRKFFLKMLSEFPPLDKGALKTSGIGRAVMLLYKHPKETTENRRQAGKIISHWARPIFNVSTNFHEMSREERENRDKANIPETKRRRLSSGAEEKRSLNDDDDMNTPRKPGDKGWIGRARVPMPSHRDYVNRPESKIESYDFSKSVKPAMSRFEKHARKLRDKKTLSSSRKAVVVSLNGSKMDL